MKFGPKMNALKSHIWSLFINSNLSGRICTPCWISFYNLETVKAVNLARGNIK